MYRCLTCCERAPKSDVAENGTDRPPADPRVGFGRQFLYLLAAARHLTRVRDRRRILSTFIHRHSTRKWVYTLHHRGSWIVNAVRLARQVDKLSLTKRR